MKHRRMIVLRLLVGLLVTAVTLTTSVVAQESEVILYQENFDNGPAPDWELEPGWQVIREGENGVLAGEGHQWASFSQKFATDFRLQFRLKLVQGRIHLVYRLNDDGRYFIGFDEGGSDLNKQYWPDTFLGGLARSDTPHSLNNWHQIEIDGQGTHIRFLVDGALAWEYSDEQPLLGGSFAFETLDDSIAYVDDIVVFGPEGEPTAVPTPSLTVNSQQSTINNQLSWVRTGGPLGGLGYDIRMRPDNPDIMYVTDAWAGVHKSSDGGQTWLPANEGITTRAGESGDAIPVFCLTIDPHDYDTIWVGTQNVRGIFKSTDAGLTWVEMDNGIVEYEGITFRGFAVDPRTSDIVYAAAELSSWVASGQERLGREFDMTGGVVYKTEDGGQNWTAVWRGNNLARYIWIDPNAPETIYISTGIFDREAANSEPDSGTPGGEGIIKSMDGGNTWQSINNGLGNLYVGTLFMHPESSILLAGTGNNQYFDRSGVYLTTNGGTSWQHTLPDEGINAVEFAETDPQIAYAGSAGAIYRSEDAGNTWQLMSGGNEAGWGPPGVRAGFPIDFQVDPRDSNRIFANNYGGGNFVSNDGGHTWDIASQGYTGAQVRDIAVEPAAGGRVFAAARSGLFVSQDGGSEWTGLNYPPAAAMEWYVVALDPADSQHVLAANNWNGKILESNNGGQAWRQAGQHAGEGKSWRAIVFAPTDPQTVYAGTSAFYSAGTFDARLPASGVYVSHDGGTGWQAANDSLSQDANVTALSVDPQDSLVVYAATGNHGLLKTSDGGNSWTAVTQGLPDSQPLLSIAHHPSAPVLFAGLERTGLYRSDDGGLTWQPAGAGLNPESSISDIIFDPTNAQVLYAADKLSGVYRSADGGATWTAVNKGLRNRSVNALAMPADGRHLYAATEGEGVFRLDLAGQPPPLSDLMAGEETAVSSTPAQPADQPEGTPVVESGSAVGTQIPAWPIIGGAAILLLALLALFWQFRRGS